MRKIFFINKLILFSILGILGLLFFNYFFLDYNYILNNNLSLISKIKYVHLIHGLISSIQLLIFFICCVCRKIKILLYF